MLLELVCAAATVVVVKLVLSEDAELVEDEDSELCVEAVEVYVDVCVVVLPRESVVL